MQIAKIATAGDGTGIGDKLKKLKLEFNKVNWSTFQADESLRDIRRFEWAAAVKDTYKDKCAAELRKTEPARKAVSEIEREAKALADQWARSKLIPNRP